MMANQTNMIITPLSPILRTCFLLLTIMFLSSGFLSKYQDHFDQMVLAENCENDMKAEEKEGKEPREDDNNLNELLGKVFWHPLVVTSLVNRNSYFWANCLIDIFSQPPEQA